MVRITTDSVPTVSGLGSYFFALQRVVCVCVCVCVCGRLVLFG